MYKIQAFELSIGEILLGKLIGEFYCELLNSNSNNDDIRNPHCLFHLYRMTSLGGGLFSDFFASIALNGTFVRVKILGRVKNYRH